MTGFPPERDDDRFREVLGRLDALVRRSYPDDEPPLPPPAVSEATIPVLTDVYSPAAREEDVHSLLPGTTAQALEQAVAEVLPGVVEALEDVLARQVRPALSVALDAAIADLRPQIEEKVRQYLLQAIAKGKDQVEM